jgi:hypothetical protein
MEFWIKREEARLTRAGLTMEVRDTVTAVLTKHHAAYFCVQRKRSVKGQGYLFRLPNLNPESICRAI